MILQQINDDLWANKDLAYKSFTAKLIPNVNPNLIIGVRSPKLKELAKKYAFNEHIDEFLTQKHEYLEQKTLHALIINRSKNYDLTIRYLQDFLPTVDNWATCDCIRPVTFKRNTEKLKPQIIKWIASDYAYTKRFGIEMAMTYYLDDKFCKEFVDVISEVKSDEYYVNMMVAWYFATALAKQWDSVIHVLEQKKLSVFTHNKTIRKAIESYRITNEQKQYLKTLTIK